MNMFKELEKVLDSLNKSLEKIREANKTMNKSLEQQKQNLKKLKGIEHKSKEINETLNAARVQPQPKTIDKSLN